MQQSKASGFFGFVSSGHQDDTLFKVQGTGGGSHYRNSQLIRQGNNVNISPKKPKLKEGDVSLAWVLASKSAEESEIQF